LPAMRPNALQDAADLIGEIDRHTFELGTGADQVAHGMRREAFDARLPVPAGAYALSRSRAPTRLLALKSGLSPSVACLKADNRQTGCLEAPIEPRYQELGDVALIGNEPSFSQVCTALPCRA